MIPKKIYQSWKTKKLSDKMSQIVENTQKMNPDYSYELFDDADCRQFILTHFGPNYANAFDILIPGAFKCDFWRYAKLYVDGGIYMDMDMVPLVPFDQMLNERDEFVSVVDSEPFAIFAKLPGIFQSFIACRPKHPILLLSLQLSFANIVTRRTGPLEQLSITGPVVMAIAFNLYRENPDTHASISPGIHNNGIRLFTKDSKYTYGLDNKQLFLNKYDGYSGVTNYWAMDRYYKDDPRMVMKVVIKYGFIFFAILSILGLIYVYIYKKRLTNCQSSCSRSSFRTSLNY